MTASKEELRARWRNEEQRIDAIVDDLRHSRDWTRHLRESESPRWGVLPHVDECRRQGPPIGAAPRDLRGIPLRDVDLPDVEGLADTVLDHASFHNVRLDRASLTGSSLCEATFDDQTSLKGAKIRFSSLDHAVLKGASLRDAELRNTSLIGCDLRDADLRHTQFIDAKLVGCDFRDADLRGTLFRRVKIKEEGFLPFPRNWTRFGGHWQTGADLDENTSGRLREHIARSSEIHELRQKRPMFSRVKYLFSNHGRSAMRFGFWTLGGTWLVFALLYTSLPVTFKVGDNVVGLSLGDAMYFSAVTITTLGYGDISPAITDGLARFLVGAEAVAGVVVLGVFIDRLVREQPRDWE